MYENPKRSISISLLFIVFLFHVSLLVYVYHTIYRFLLLFLVSKFIDDKTLVNTITGAEVELRTLCLPTAGLMAL